MWWRDEDIQICIRAAAIAVLIVGGLIGIAATLFVEHML